MNARISISVDYDYIPEEGNAVIQRALTRNKLVVQYVEEARLEEDINKKLELLEKARKLLVLVDANLEDSYHIFLGYAKNELELKTPKENNGDAV